MAKIFAAAQKGPGGAIIGIQCEDFLEKGNALMPFPSAVMFEARCKQLLNFSSPIIQVSFGRQELVDPDRTILAFDR